METVTTIVFTFLATLGLLTCLCIIFSCIDGPRSFIKALLNLDDENDEDADEDDSNEEA